MQRRCVVCDKGIPKLLATDNAYEHSVSDQPLNAVVFSGIVPTNGTLQNINVKHGVLYEITMCENCLTKHADVINKIEDGAHTGHLSEDIT